MSRPGIFLPPSPSLSLNFTSVGLRPGTLRVLVVCILSFTSYAKDSSGLLVSTSRGDSLSRCYYHEYVNVYVARGKNRREPRVSVITSLKSRFYTWCGQTYNIICRTDFRPPRATDHLSCPGPGVVYELFINILTAYVLTYFIRNFI